MSLERVELEMSIQGFPKQEQKNSVHMHVHNWMIKDKEYGRLTVNVTPTGNRYSYYSTNELHCMCTTDIDKFLTHIYEEVLKNA
ncbi:MAG: hypothetical protein HRU18_03085 [Pseudoalteromonas sp.]|uniref:hypothetical protein n=1 Tax=Pseudoalteromonas sp. TaxID=53249 RepID=UPI001D1E2B32|nr:hypothetical protein [Pseudoalteromonas sp.]NRA77169.1 hypothetical protein [Pseudoalteromonas sp.]